jgi:tetratricopeptide (TPR) repeat protein
MSAVEADAAGAMALSPRARAVAACALFAIGLCLYGRTLHYDFVDWDDTAQVVENPWIRSLSLDHLESIFTQPVVASYFPLQSVTFMLDYALWGLDPRGFHAQSLLINALNAALAFWVLTRLTRNPELAFIAALLWSVHHTHVEAVAWVSARKEVLSSALLLLSLGTYLRARRSEVLHRPAYAASVLLFGLAAAAKLTVASYLLFFLLVDRFEDAHLAPEQRRSIFYHLSTKLPYLVAALPFVWVNVRFQPVGLLGVTTGFDYMLVRGQAGWRYLWLLLGLLPGQPIYDPPPISHDPYLATATLLPLVVPPVAFAIALWRRYTNVASGLAWLIIGLLAPLAFPLVTYMADRYLYLPSLGLCWVLAAAISKLAFVPWRLRALNVVVALLLTAAPALWFAGLTWHYTPAWRNSESLWTYAVATSRDDRAASALSAELIRQSRFEEAERVQTQASLIGTAGYMNLAFLYLRRDQFEKALHATDQAIETLRVQPLPREDRSKLMFLRATALANLQHPAEAMTALRNALELDPNNASARATLEAIEPSAAPGPPAP